METAVVALSCSLVVLSITTGLCLGAIPFLWWKVAKLEANLDKVDETLAEFLKTAIGEPVERGEQEKAMKQRG
jgi:hypothetical protein